MPRPLLRVSDLLSLLFFFRSVRTRPLLPLLRDYPLRLLEDHFLFQEKIFSFPNPKPSGIAGRAVSRISTTSSPAPSDHLLYALVQALCSRFSGAF